ncbi:MAG: hypothetical protein L0211_02270 [Planctomycetaceae bacterium]|nr:hypothetical protein [Planctomycetaceae bacterium]
MGQPDTPNLGHLNEAPSFPRLSINHFFLLTLTVSFSLACMVPHLQETMQMATDQFVGGRKWQSIAGTVTDTVAGGIKLFGLIVLVRGWVRGQRFTMAPGHWFFLIVGPMALYGLVSDPVATLVYFRWGANRYIREFNAAHNAINAAMFLMGVMVCTRAIVSVKPRRWQACMAVLCASLSCIAVLSGAKVSQHLWSAPGWYSQHLVAMWGNLQFAFEASFVVAAIIDAAWHVRRDWLHYLAIATILLDSVATAASFEYFLMRWWSSAIARLWS